MASIGYRDVLADIKKGKDLSPVFILMGEETFYIDKLVEAFENHVIPEEDKDFNQNIFYGNDTDIDTVVASAQQFPVMAGRKLVILKESQTMHQAKTQLDKLASYLSRPNKSTILVIVYKGDNLSSTSKLLKAASSSKAVIFKSELVKEWNLSSHVKDYCSSIGFSIEDKAVGMLCEYIGSPLSKLFGEVNKLAMIKGKDNRITAIDVEKHIGISKDFNNFELIKAVSTKNYPNAMKIMRYFELNPKTNPTVMTNSMLFGFFQKISICHYLNDKSEKGLMEGLGFKNAWQLRDIKEGLRNYNPRQAVNCVHFCREFDTKSKGVDSFQNEYNLLRELIFKIFTT
ncbi:MAG: DNA polymerase III subunit delta [Muribaculaceae bacterium]|nr:DNA polymerase III subunit delta [Muribaculaceae bacterium]